MKRITRWPAQAQREERRRRRSARRPTAPADCWMKIAAKPAVSRREAGTSASSSRLRALTRGCPVSSARTRSSASSRERSLWSVKLSRRRGRDLLERHAGRVPALVEVDAERQLVRAARGRSRRCVSSRGPCRRSRRRGWRARRRPAAGGRRPSSSRTRAAAAGAGAAGAAGRASPGSGAVRSGGGSRAGAADPPSVAGMACSATVPCGGTPPPRRRSRLGGRAAARPGAVGSASPANVSYSAVRCACGSAVTAPPAVAGPCADVLEAEQDDGDVVAPAGLVGRGDQRAADLLERAARCSQQRLELRLVDHRRSGRRSRAGRGRRRAPGRPRRRPRRPRSAPSARVITERCGCDSACSSVSLPRATSSPTSEWSRVRRIRSPSRSR